MSTSSQARVFLVMLLCGVGAGVMHDLFSVLRRGAIFTSLADILLGLFLAAGMIGAGLLLGCDPFRLYALVGVAAGWMGYWLSLRTIVRVLTQTIEKLSKKAAD